MARLDVEKKRKTAWPWLVGAVVVVLLGIAITSLLTADPETEPALTVPTVEDTHPPAAVPRPPNVDPELTGTEAARGVEEIAPLGEEDVGQTIRVDGQVVATGNAAFWLRTGDIVLRIDSERQVQKGEALSIEGTVRQADPAKTDRIAADVLSREPGASEWQVVRLVKLVEGGTGGGAEDLAS